MSCDQLNLSGTNVNGHNYGDETRKKLVKNEDTTGSCSMQEGNAREKLDYGKPDGVRNYPTVRN